MTRLRKNIFHQNVHDVNYDSVGPRTAGPRQRLRLHAATDATRFWPATTTKSLAAAGCEACGFPQGAPEPVSRSMNGGGLASARVINNRRAAR